MTTGESAATHFQHLVFRKSSASKGESDCVEVAFFAGGAVVRDSKAPDAGAFALPAAGWRGLLAAIRAGRPGL